MIAHPFLKYAGGKTALLPEIRKRVPERFKYYYEPFVGGGAVFFDLVASGRIRRATLSDTNAELIETYRAIRGEVDVVIRRLKEHVYTKTHYYATRAHEPRTSGARAARMIYLNRSGFNGLYRVNKAGKFNVPFGRHTNPTICDEENLRAVSDALQVPGGLYPLDFERAVSTAERGDFVYFDCPYVPLNTTSNFTSYTRDGFTAEDQARLADCARQLAKRGVYVLLSNSDTPLVRKLYKGFKIERVEAPRRINSKGGKRGNVGELLISGRSG